MKVGDLVKCTSARDRRGPPSIGVGTIIEQMPDADPNYVAWHVLLHDEIQVVHESFLEVVK